MATPVTGSLAESISINWHEFGTDSKVDAYPQSLPVESSQPFPTQNVVVAPSTSLDPQKEFSILSDDPDDAPPATPSEPSFVTNAEIAKALTKSTNPEDGKKTPLDWLKISAIATLIVFGILTAICALCATGIYPPEMLGGSVCLTYCFAVGLVGVAIGGALFYLSTQRNLEKLPASQKV